MYISFLLQIHVLVPQNLFCALFEPKINFKQISLYNLTEKCIYKTNKVVLKELPHSLHILKNAA